MELKDDIRTQSKCISNETINFDTSNIEPTQSGTVTKTSTWIWQYLTQSVNFLWLKIKDLFPSTQVTTHNYIPKIDNTLKKLVKSNINDDGSRVQIDSPLRVNSNVYYDVAYLKGGGTGIIKIKTPWSGINDTNNTMSIIEIDIRDHSSEKGAKLTVYFYVYNSTLSYYRVWATLIGDLPSKVIRTCYDPINKCILIGEETTVWSNLLINMSKVTNGFNRTSDDSTGWDISYITDTSTYTGITNIKHINKGLDADLLDGKHASEFATSTQGAKADTALQSITKAMVEAVLTGVITSHDHNYTTSSDVQNLINTAVASVYKPKGNIANKAALLALTNVKQGDVYNAQSAFTLNGQNIKIGDNIVCLADAATSLETNWDNLGGNIDFAAALSQALIDFGATSGNITSSDTILSAINKLAYDKHTHSNKAILDAITATFTTALKNNYDTAYNNSHTHSNKAILDAISAAFTTALKNSYDGAVTSSHTHSNKTILDAITAAFTTELKTKLENLSDGGWVQYVEDSPLTKKYIPFDNVTSFGWKSGSGLIITMYQRFGTNAFEVSDSYDCMELFECSYSTPNKTDIDEGVVYPNPVNQAKIAKRNIWTDSPDVAKYKHKLTEGIFGSLGTLPANNNLSTWLTTTFNGVAGYALKNNSSIFTDLSGGTAYYLNITQIGANMKMGMNYTFVGRATGAGAVTFDVVDSRGSSSTNLTIGQIVSFDFVRIATGIVLYRNFEVR